MAREFWIAEIRAPEAIEDKLHTKHNLSGDEIRAACIPRAYNRASWHDHPVHGRRLAALPEVIEELKKSGYTVEEVGDDDSAQAAVTQLPPQQTYRLEPGPATMTALTNPTDYGSIQFVLTGPKFGMRFGTEEADPVLWMRLVTLGVRLGETYMVVPSRR